MAGDADKVHIEMMAFTMSVNDVYLVATIIAAIALPLSLFIGKSKRKGAAKAESEAA